MNTSPANPAEVLLAELRDQGIQVVAAGDRLRYRPASAMSDEMVQRVAAHKQELLDLLAGIGQSDSYWSAAARRLIASCPEAGLQSDLADLFEETTAILHFDQGISAADAEMQGFGALLFRILQLGVDARATP